MSMICCVAYLGQKLVLSQKEGGGGGGSGAHRTMVKCQSSVDDEGMSGKIACTHKNI